MAENCVYAYKQALLQDLQQLISIPSVRGVSAPGAPYGIETLRALGFILSRARELGFTTKNVGGHAGHVEFGSRGPLIAVLVHLDVVPAGTGWVHDPFGGELDNGCVYGRGASDNKGPAVAALYSLRAFADEVGEELQSPARFRIIYGLNEESGMEGVKHYFEHEPLPDYGFSPDAAYPLLNREKGIAHVYLRGARRDLSGLRTLSGGLAFNMVPDRATAVLDERAAERVARFVEKQYRPQTVSPRVTVSPEKREIEAIGTSAHGGDPTAGVNAIGHLLQLLKRVDQEEEEAQGAPLLEWPLQWVAENLILDTRGERVGVACHDEESGELSVNLGLATITPEEIELGLDIRYPVTWEWRTIRGVLAERAQEAGLTLTEKQHLEPLHIPSDAPIIRALLRAYTSVTGEAAQPQSMAGGTYARMLRNRGVTFGANFPGEDTRGHRPDEFIHLESLMKHAEIQTRALHELSRLGRGAAPPAR